VEYLVSMTTHVPEGTSDAAVQDIRGREAAHSRELATQGHLLRAVASAAATGRMANPWPIRRRRRHPAREGSLLDAAADMAHR
jgi:hypothetical protein